MSFGASLIHAVYRLSGVKKLYSLPEDELLKAIEKANRVRGFFLPADHKAYYEKKMIGDFPCLIVRAAEMPAKRAILFFFGGGMVIGPDKGDAAVLRKLCFGTDSDVWFPIYPLCTEHCLRARVRLRGQRRKGLCRGLLVAAGHPVGDEPHRSLPDRRLLGRPYKGVDHPRHRGSEAVYPRRGQTQKMALRDARHGGHRGGAGRDHVHFRTVR